ncbi:uncharacterized protein LOC123315151 isoform X1 [Coccinella septempunctata]|nr:uncharacterized protein LOC123315151 isoform X1 [Coccinella septempunctata]
MPSVTANFMLSQIRNFKAKSANARRWTLDDKIIALSLFKRSPRCYNLLRKFAALPSKNTILKLLKMVPFKVGINESIFNQLNENLPKDIHQRCCALLFDEMDIKEGVQYDMGEDKILGFEDFGDTNFSKRLATKALVFMLVGLGKNWKQPVAYYFSHRGCNAAELKKCLLEVLSAAKHVAKVDVAVTVCDMGTSNVRCIKELGATKETPFFFFENSKVHCMFDPPHLLKCTYSLFRKHNVSLPVTIGETILNKVAKFQDVIAAYEIDNRNTIVFRTLWKIKATYLKPILQYAMKVNIAAKVMSHTVAAYIFSLISAGQMNPEAIGTASFIKEVDTLFDSMNGKSDDGPFGKELKGPLSVRSPHIQYWEEESQRIKKWSFIRYTKTGTLKQSMPPSQTGWLQSIKAVQGLWEYLRELGFKSLKTRTLNQDPLENLFGQIRYGCGCNDNPTVQQFIGSLKTQLLNGLVSQSFRGRNCEKDDNELVCNLKSFLNIPPQSLERETVEEASLTNEAPQISVEVLSAEIAGEVSSGSPKILSVAYVAGAILKVVKKHICCSLCDSMLTASDLEPQNLFIMNKEWSDQRSVLLYPSESYTVSIGCGITVLEEFLDESPSHPKVKVTALAVLSTMNFDHLACSEHKSHIRDITTAALCRIGIPWWCRRKCEEVKTEAKTRSMNKKLKKILHQ